MSDPDTAGGADGAPVLAGAAGGVASEYLRTTIQLGCSLNA
ncbi:MAG: hypothetical protein U0163_01750 [Gemmatimonadaceae bacterium]